MFAAPTPYQGHLWAGMKIGLLGGSFNPAHEGHRHISLLALQRLGLDAVWWMVSPQNPLKAASEMAPLPRRMESAKDVSDHPRIIPTDIETQMSTRFTVDTLKKLKVFFPKTHFTWLMGTDNLHQVKRWRRWQEIFTMMPVCILARPPEGSSLISSAPMERFRGSLVGEACAKTLPITAPPAWTVLHIPLNSLSATEIRARQKWL